MIARLLISPDLDSRIESITQIISSHFSYISSESLNHPDLLYFKHDSKLGIEQARQIKSFLSVKPHSLKGKIVVLENAAVLTLEAQNALLKILEEPPKESLIILGANSESDLLPTILSRCQSIYIQSAESERNTSDVKQLLELTIEERFEYIEKLKDKDKFLKDLIAFFHHNLRLQPKSVNVTILNELLEAEKWAKQNVNIRAILEYLMLVIP